MKNISESWCIQIDITNYCTHKCLYCSRYNRHLRPNQRKHMNIETFLLALKSLKDWPTKIGIIGGEPLLHPEFKLINYLLRKHFPKDKLGLWTSGIPNTDLTDPRTDPDIMRTYGFVAYNPHTIEQKKKCRHQPLTIAISEVVPENIMWKLIDQCWVQRTWCATITHKGAYFCEVAAAQDILLNEGQNAWQIEDNWWEIGPDSSKFQEQVKKLCPNCGMALPLERETLEVIKEKITPLLLKKFTDSNLLHTSKNDIEIFHHVFTKGEINKNIMNWYPGNYREDLTSDELAGEGRGFMGFI